MSEEINKAVHGAMGLSLGHNFVPKTQTSKVNEICAYCHADLTPENESGVCEKVWGVPDYCTDLNAVAKAEAFVVKKVGEMHLVGAIALANYDGDHTRNLVFASAKTRSLAVLAALNITPPDSSR
jgi:hypothetical protein